uniref:Uncharacterized protein n=1 Tax=Zea mays TaxID=4577 RepID=A0A804RCJ5_MAIZE
MIRCSRRFSVPAGDRRGERPSTAAATRWRGRYSSARGGSSRRPPTSSPAPTTTTATAPTRATTPPPSAPSSPPSPPTAFSPLSRSPSSTSCGATVAAPRRRRWPASGASRGSTCSPQARSCSPWCCSRSPGGSGSTPCSRSRSSARHCSCCSRPRRWRSGTRPTATSGTRCWRRPRCPACCTPACTWTPSCCRTTRGWRRSGGPASPGSARRACAGWSPWSWAARRCSTGACPRRLWRSSSRYARGWCAASTARSGSAPGRGPRWKPWAGCSWPPTRCTSSAGSPRRAAASAWRPTAWLPAWCSSASSARSTGSWRGWRRGNRSGNPASAIAPFDS